MRLQLADQSIYYPKRVLEEAIVRVGQSYVPMDFVVVETGGGERAPIILR
jgi:nitrogen fixation protein